MFQWRIASMTDPGCQRTNNQDNFYISPDERVLAVCDGMGGSIGGAEAARLAVATVDNIWHKNPPHPTDGAAIRQWIASAISSANESIYTSANNDASLHGIGSTIAIAIQSANKSIEIGNVGDSRIYLFRRGPNKQNESVLLTEVHTEIKKTAKRSHNPYMNLITRCLGHNDQVEASYATTQLTDKDWIILCTDGLNTVLLDDQIGQILSQSADPNNACKNLIKETREGGAPDNVTVIAIRYCSTDGDDPPTAPVRLSPKPKQQGAEISLSLPVDKDKKEER